MLDDVKRITLEPISIEPVIGIYQIRNLNNDKIYIGQSVDVCFRRYQHSQALRRSEHANGNLQADYDELGGDAFVSELLMTCHESMLDWYEQQFIKQLGPEYNIPDDEIGKRRGKSLKRAYAEGRRVSTFDCKLTDTQVGEIRVMWESGEHLQKDIAKMFDISKAYVSQLVNLKRREVVNG